MLAGKIHKLPDGNDVDFQLMRSPGRSFCSKGWVRATPRAMMAKPVSFGPWPSSAFDLPSTRILIHLHTNLSSIVHTGIHTH